MVSPIHGLCLFIPCVPAAYMALARREHVHNKDDDLHRLIILHHGCAAILELV